MYKNFKLSDEERKQIMEMHQSHGYKQPINENEDVSGGDESSALKQQSSEVVQELSPEEQEMLKSFIENNPNEFKHIVKQEVSKEKAQEEMQGAETEMTEDDDIGMSDKEFQVRRIIHKIVTRVGVGSALAIVPAAMFISGGVALGLGVASVALTGLKDLAWYKKGGRYNDHHYKAQQKSDYMDMKAREKMEEGEDKELNESSGPLDGEQIMHHSRRLARAIDELREAMKRGNIKAIEEMKDMVKMEFRRFKMTVEDMESVIRRL